jgi:protein-tyrosine-phosphatase/predicted ATP-grasp superfamily ATP-dependent carboligase
LQGNVLVLGRGDRAFLSVIRSLGRAGLNVHVGMCEPDELALKSRYVREYHRIPGFRPGDSTWLDTIEQLLSATRFDLVVPCNDHAVIPLQLHKEQLGRLARVYALSDRAFEIAFDKIKTFELAGELGIAQPRGKVIATDEPIDSALEGLSLPAVIKPPSSFTAENLSAKRSVVRVRSVEEAERQLRAAHSWGQALVQENFVGAGVGVELLAKDGKTLLALQHERVHEPLEGGGSSYRKTTPLHPDLLAASQALLGALRYTGVAMVEFKLDHRSGKWAFIEINGRFWGSLPLAEAAGADFPLSLYQMLVNGQETFPNEYRTGMYCRNLSADFHWLFANLKADRSDPLLATRPLSKVALEPLNLLTLRERWDSLAIDDLRPGLAECKSLVTAMARKLGKVVSRRLASTRSHRKRASSQLIKAAEKAKSILFVCKGNICRSPFAERYATSVLPHGIDVKSCGYYPVSRRHSPDEAVRAAAAYRVDLSNHRSVLLSDELLAAADMIVVFDDSNVDRIRSEYPAARNRIFKLGVLCPDSDGEIRDPWGGDDARFAAAYSQITEAIDGLSHAFNGKRTTVPVPKARRQEACT